ncbi:MAG: magnesium/cobalt transporter CorA [Candidatus Latescibacter sp.]|nr:magnesium/cobalt transporter CorA [Candidatus Latescibacter sp.]
MITMYSYNIAEGTLACPQIEELPALFEAENVDLWVDLESPTHEEAEILSAVFDFHELAIEDCVATENEEAKIDDYDNYLFLVFHSILFNSEKLIFDFDELDMFFGEHYVVTYHKKPVIGVNQLRKRLERDLDFMAQGTDEILHAILDALVDNYVASIKRLERTIYKLEAEILAEASQKTFNELFLLKRGLINLRRIMTPAEEVVEQLGTMENELIQEENRVYFQDIHDHISSIQGLLQSYTEMVSGTMDTYVSLTTHRMTNVMRTLTIISTILLPQTLIASIFGMNLDLPFQKSPLGFYIIIGMDVLITGGMLWYFKIKDWF